jgi:hypothetical protein
MRKSQSITLTVVAAMGMAARAQQAPTPSAPAALKTCEERRSAAAAAGTAFSEKCNAGSSAHGTSHGGFGATGKGKGHSGCG